MGRIFLGCCFIGICQANVLLAQEKPFSLIQDVDYTIPQFEIINEEFKSCLDTFSITPNTGESKYPYLLLSFDPNLAGPQLYESYFLPPVFKSVQPTPFGYVEYKGYPLIIQDTPPVGWFRKTEKEKRFKGTVWITHGGGGNLWMLIILVAYDKTDPATTKLQETFDWKCS